MGITFLNLNRRFGVEKSLGITLGVSRQWLSQRGTAKTRYLGQQHIQQYLPNKHSGIQVKVLTFIQSYMTVTRYVPLLQTLLAFIFTTACLIYYPQRSSRSCIPASSCGPTTPPCPRTSPLNKKKKRQLQGAAQQP